MPRVTVILGGVTAYKQVTRLALWVFTLVIRQWAVEAILKMAWGRFSLPPNDFRGVIAGVVVDSIIPSRLPASAPFDEFARVMIRRLL